MLDREEVQAIAEEAHARGVLVRAHVKRASVLDIVLEAGVDVIEYVPLPQLSEVEVQSLLEDSDHITLPSELESRLTRLVDQGVVMVPTLDVLIGKWYAASDLTPEQQSWRDFVLEMVRRFHALGGIVALGNDFGPTTGVKVGMPMREMELLLATGLTPMEIIEAGTSRAAEVCGHGDELGTLEPGKLADVIVVNGDPLTDIGAMNQVIVVIKGGEVAYTSE